MDAILLVAARELIDRRGWSSIIPVSSALHGPEAESPHLSAVFVDSRILVFSACTAPNPEVASLETVWGTSERSVANASSTLSAPRPLSREGSVDDTIETATDSGSTLALGPLFDEGPLSLRHICSFIN